MRLVDLHNALTQKGVRVIVGHGLDLSTSVNYRDEGDTFDDSDSERQFLDTATSGIVVRRSGWVWVMGYGGRIMRGFAGSKKDGGRIDHTHGVLREVLGLDAQPETIGPDDDPVFAVPDEQENPDDPREVAG